MCVGTGPYHAQHDMLTTPSLCEEHYTVFYCKNQWIVCGFFL